MPTQRIERLHAHISELGGLRAQQETVVTQVARMRDQCRHALRQIKAVDLVVSRTGGALWEHLKTPLGELAASVKSTAHEAAIAGRSMAELKTDVGRISTSLEHGVAELRLLPLGPYLEDMAHVVRDAARRAGKQVRYQVEAEAELDRTVLESLREPLTHLLRNAVVHGLESPAQRLAAGKPEQGLVCVRARGEGSRAIVEIDDDGAGIAVADVRRRADELGLVSASTPEVPDAGTLLDWICRPGFSTRAEASELAGRGIGLDVVTAAIKDLGGFVELETAPGDGTRFRLNVPITASTGTSIYLRAGEFHCGLLSNAIDRIVRVSPKDFVALEGHPTVAVGGQLVSVAALATLLGIPDVGADLVGARFGVVVQLGRRRLVVLVDDVVDQGTIVIKPLGTAFARCDYLLGGAIMADNNILPVLKPSALFDRAQRGAAAAHWRPQTLTRERRTGDIRVLVVDDSITMRTLERNILLAAGYQVEVASDGVGALEEMKRGDAFDLVITDLQMPRMNGVELCRAVRAGAHSETPVVVVTAVAEAEDRARALRAGADAYIVKAEFEQEALLRLVARLTGVAGRAA